MPTDDIDKQIKDGAKAISRDRAGPAGQIALDRVVARHLPWFDLCQERGMAWPQIVSILHAAGAGRATGLPFSHSHLSAVVWRQRQKARSEDPGVVRGAVAVTGHSGAPSFSERGRAADKPATKISSSPGRTRKAPQPFGKPKTSDSRAASTAFPSGTTEVKRTRLPSHDIRVSMKRAADLRRSSDDD
jgi:hypothetical protein